MFTKVRAPLRGARHSAEAANGSSLAAVTCVTCPGHPTISACLIVRNEAHVLERCLVSLRDVVDEIVVVDTGSADDSPAVATRHGARVIRVAWPDDFSAARNVSIEAAACDWILSIDADEYLSPDAARLVRPTVERSDAMGLWIAQRNLLPPGDVLPFIDTPIVRLFRRHPKVRFAGIIHEQVTSSIERLGGRVAGTSIVVMHDGYLSETAQSAGRRCERNLGILLRAAEAEPDDPYWHYQLGVTFQTLNRVHDARRHLQRVFELPHEHLNAKVVSASATRLAQLALRDRRHGSALRYARLALECESGDVLAHYLAGIALARLSRYPEAHAHLSAVKQSGRASQGAAVDVEALLGYCATRMAEAAAGDEANQAGHARRAAVRAMKA